jgi:uncharacterized phage-associated protein
MIAYKKEKLDNAICYFANEHHRRTGRYLSQTILYKFLAFLDFKTLEKTGKPALELEYKALKRGPVPHRIYNNIEKYEKKGCFTFSRTGNAIIVIPGDRQPNFDYFSETETGIMQGLVNKYSRKGIIQRNICASINKDSHEMEAWKIAWNRKPNSVIKYDDIFYDIDSKPPEELTPQEENYLTYKGLKEIASCR